MCRWCIGLILKIEHVDPLTEPLGEGRRVNRECLRAWPSALVDVIKDRCFVDAGPCGQLIEGASALQSESIGLLPEGRSVGPLMLTSIFGSGDRRDQRLVRELLAKPRREVADAE
jgi:hypothetical protein